MSPNNTPEAPMAAPLVSSNRHLRLTIAGAMLTMILAALDERIDDMNREVVAPRNGGSVCLPLGADDLQQCRIIDRGGAGEKDRGNGNRTAPHGGTVKEYLEMIVEITAIVEAGQRVDNGKFHRVLQVEPQVFVVTLAPYLCQ